MSIVSRTRGSVSVTPGRAARAFTLVELMVIMAVLGILMMILVPSLDQAVEIAYSTMCKSNLKGLGQAMHGNSVNAPLTVPSGANWTGQAVQYGSKELLICKKDDEEHRVGMDSLEEYYLLQKTHTGTWTVTSVAAALGLAGGILEDWQIHLDHELPREPPAHTGGHPCWCKIPPHRAENQQLLSICSEAHILITLETSYVTLESWHGCTVGPRTASDHWLMRGPGTEGDASLQVDEVIMQLGGRTFDAEPSPRLKHIINAEEASYGINSVIEPKRFGPGQIMLMDANSVEICVGEGDWLEYIKPRHLGKVNYVDVGGSVHSTTVTDLYDEYLLYEKEGPFSRSLWNHKASPRKKP